MAIGDVTAAEGRRFRDPVSAAAIRQLTAGYAHDQHLYFTDSGLWDDGRRLLFLSHRGNAANLYSVELASGEITQVTDFPDDGSARRPGAFVNPRRAECYTVAAGRLLAVDLRTFRQRDLYAPAEGFRLGNFSATADGETVCVAEQQDLTGPLRMDTSHGYIGFADYHAARPTCRILAIPVGGGPPRCVHEEPCWIGHVNTSPALPDVLTFCHEGPWDRVEQRMWRLTISTGEAAALRPQAPEEAVGHEYWFADGERVGFHGRFAEGHRFGIIRWDGSGHEEWDFPHGSTHFHSLDERLIVGDGGRDEPHLLVWRLAGEAYEGPRILAFHRCSFHTQIQHVHPRMFTDGEGRLCVLYAGDHNGYGNVFIVEVPEFESLPRKDGVP
jgi:oligogalacturonide lyase